MNKKFIILSVISLLIIFSLVYISIRTISHQDKAAIKIDVFPSDAQLIVGDKTIKPGSTTHLDPGVYDIQASREGFNEQSTALNIDINSTSFALFLDPHSDEAIQWVKDNQKEYEEARLTNERFLIESGKTFNKNSPIAKHLPYKTFTYTLGYINDESDPSGNSIIVTVQAGEGYRQQALYKIRQLGFDPTDLNIIFRDYENPFPL